MKKLILFTFFIFSGSLWAYEVNPGFYMPVTIALKYKEGYYSTKYLNNGNMEYTYTIKQYAVTNATILTELMHNGSIPYSPSIKGWKIVVRYRYDYDGLWYQFYALNGQYAVYIGDRLGENDEGNYLIKKGKEVYSPYLEKTVSGSHTGEGLGGFYIDMGRSRIELRGTQSFSKTYTKTKGGWPLWKINSTKFVLSGVDYDGNVYQGTVSYGKPVLMDNVYAIFRDY